MIKINILYIDNYIHFTDVGSNDHGNHHSITVII